MKFLLALTLVLMSVTSQAVAINSGNNMGAEPAPRRDTTSSVTDTNARTYGEESAGTRVNDSISTGQSSTSRNTTTTTTTSKVVRPTARCIDKDGYSYFKNDSGYASCVNSSSGTMKDR